MKKTQTAEARNLLELTPRWTSDWKQREDGLVTILMPRFGTHAIVRKLFPKLSQSTIPVKLDAFGSFVWKRCDGSTRVQTIAEDMKKEFGDSVEPVFDRLNTFIARLEREQMLSTREPVPPASPQSNV